MERDREGVDGNRGQELRLGNGDAKTADRAPDAARLPEMHEGWLDKDDARASADRVVDLVDQLVAGEFARGGDDDGLRAAVGENARPGAAWVADDGDFGVVVAL